jgi:hypothetical protein
VGLMLSGKGAVGGLCGPHVNWKGGGGSCAWA